MNTTHQQINNNQTAGFPCTHGSPKSNVTGKTTDSKISRGINMFNKTNVLKIGLALGVAVFVTGCASLSDVSNKIINNADKSGDIYGAAWVYPGNINTARNACEAIKHKDARCANPDEYLVAGVISKMGFADGHVGVLALIKKDFLNIAVLQHEYVTGSKKMPYVKAKVIPGQLGEITEIVSIDGDGKCTWSGMPRAGGTVCPAYNWDYRKDNQAAIVWK